MIIEFFGCPGCGKTYLVESLSDDGAYKNVTASQGIRNRIKNIGKKILTYSPYAFSVREKIFKNISIASNCRGQYTQRTLKKSVKNISMLAAVYKYMSRKMYIDEGIVHRVISLCIDQKMSKEIAANIIYALRFVLEPVKVYYLDTSVDICYESIVERGRQKAGIDFLSDNEVTIMLNCYYEFCEFISAEFCFQRIDRDSEGEIE